MNVYYSQIDLHGETLYVADECNHVRWIEPGQLVSDEPIPCEGCARAASNRSPVRWTWRKVYVRT